MNTTDVARTSDTTARPATRTEGRASAASHRARRRSPRPIVHVVLALVWTSLLAAGWSYYRLPLLERVHHPAHAALKPNGTIGLAYGYLGTAFLLGIFAYSIRKRVRFLRPLGALRKWLHVHIAFGLLGPAFITLHSGFKVQGAIAIGYWAMIAVMVSGFLGYYLYRQIPRAAAGRANESELLAAEIAALDRELVQRYGFTERELEVLHRRSGADRVARLGAWSGLGFALRQDLGMLLGRRVPAGLSRHPHGRTEARHLRSLVARHVVVERRRALLRHMEAAFGYWHTIHKPFAVVLYVLLAVHVGVAVWLGYAWVW
jgi:hypothetical protein